MSSLLVSGGVVLVAVTDMDNTQALRLFWAWSWINILHVGLLIALERPGKSEADR